MTLLVLLLVPNLNIRFSIKSRPFYEDVTDQGRGLQKGLQNSKSTFGTRTLGQGHRREVSVPTVPGVGFWVLSQSLSEFRKISSLSGGLGRTKK